MHNLHLKMWNFGPFTICTLTKNCLLENFSNDFQNHQEASLQHLQLNYASCNVMIDSLTFINFQENYQLTKYISTHIMLLHSIKQYLIIVSTSFFQFYSLTLLFLLKLRIFTK